MKNECRGQINIFDIIKPEIKEPQILLTPGQRVYVLKKGDVKTATVTAETWECGTERGYRLQYTANGYGCTWNSELGKKIFTEKEEAVKRAEEFILTHDVIPAENICSVKTTAYQYIRETDNRLMTAFYAELDSGMVYIKEFMTYGHLVKAERKKEAIRQFMEQNEFKYCAPTETEYIPQFRNMYLIRQKCDWDYAEADYSLSAG